MSNAGTGTQPGMETTMKLPSTLCAVIVLGLTACSGDSSSISISDVPEGKHWQVTLDGGTPEGGTTLMRQQLPDRLALMGTGGPRFSGVILLVPMEEQYETGVFEEGVELKLPGAANVGDCEHTQDSNTHNASVSVNITENSRELFIATFTFADLECKKEAVVVSGSGVITEKRTVKN